MNRNDSKFFPCLNTFSSPVNGNSKTEKTLNAEFCIVSTNAVKIWDVLDEN